MTRDWRAREERRRRYEEETKKRLQEEFREQERKDNTPVALLIDEINSFADVKYVLSRLAKTQVELVELMKRSLK